MEDWRSSEPPRHYGFLLVPQFSMLAFTSAVEPLRAANRLSGRELYRWTVIAKEQGPVPASNMIDVIAQASTHAIDRLPHIFVCGGIESHRYHDKQIYAFLRRLERTGCIMGAVSTGSYLLARAGLLDGYRCTIHWEMLAAFQEAFPKLEVTPELYEIDRTRFTCSGGTASLDMMLGLIAVHHGRELANAVAEQFMHERIRDNRDQQRMALRSRLGVSHPKLLKVVNMMEEHLEEPLTRSDLARRAGLSTRQLERLFRKYLSRTPTRYYQELRLYRARLLLTQSSMPVLDVALACGFVSASHFSKCYREFFDRTPREERAIPA